MKKLTIILPILLATSCATIVNGTTQKVCIASDPACADVFIDHSYVGKTPLKANLTRKADHAVRIECEGYAPYEFCFKKQMSKWVFGNIAFGGFPGLAVDLLTGGVYRLTANQTQAALKAGNVACMKHDDKMVTVVLHADPSWEQIDQMTRVNI